ncbi:alanine racemase [Actinokineospora spheciospongiae]|uniref:alanine racemase n=1 Tax=Actinokineospora spheciospongiae TaxID=909613 RepID=UPI000D8DA48E|nr:alanine racemase [Actinokineospora spheciospongiae]PWW64359.1 alanine racemase [Actinokineospora spheciospongiae]
MTAVMAEPNPAPNPVRAEVVVDLDHLRHNVALLAARAGSADTLAVVKADAYGHGAVPVARAALEAGATWLGSCSLDEALALRAAGIDAPILSWLDTPGTDLAAGVAAGIDLGVSSVDQLRGLSGARLHLKVDTGLSRNGCPPRDWPELVAAAAASDNEVYAIWSHLACADEPDHPSVDAQAKRFADAHDVALAAGLTPKRHLANSAATLLRPDLHFDMVRVGIAMYGLNPVPQREDLRPVMSFRSSVALTKRLPAGESVSYGHTWTADRDTTVALVPVGYADGVPRLLSGRMEVLLAGRRRPVRGRVCMDQVVVDCGDDEVAVGAEVVLFGDGSRGEPTATEWAEAIGTIDYEVVTGMYRPRVVRRYPGAR